MNYNWNIWNWLVSMVPYGIRKVKLIYFIWACFEPIRDLFSSFLSYRSATDYDVKLNGTVIILQHLLNNKFDPTFRSIRVINPSTKREYQKMWLTTERNPPSSSPWWLTTEPNNSNSVPMFLISEHEQDVDFEVTLGTNFLVIPQGFEATIDKYKASPFRYQVRLLAIT
ncbi:MAG: hypothetical protein AAF587_29670 [Bacteroidota bacterium]